MTVRMIPSPAFDPFADDPTRGESSPESSLVRVDAFELVGGSTHQLLWSSNQIATALGYQDARDLTRKVREEWSDEFVEGTDFVVLSGDDLQGPKDAGTVGRNAPSALFLTEPGVHLVALKSHKPASRRLRRWLASEVMPSIRRTGGYSAADPRALRETRMVANALLRAGDKAGAAVLLRRLAGLPELPAVEPAPVAVAAPHADRALALVRALPALASTAGGRFVGVDNREARAVLAAHGFDPVATLQTWRRRGLLRANHGLVFRTDRQGCALELCMVAAPAAAEA